MKIPELLAPVGSMDHLKVAINSGASSVYLSGKDYGARNYDCAICIDGDGQHQPKYVNTLIKEDELEDVINYLSKLYAIGVDAVLVQDLGLIELINTHIPKLKIHASTQMTLENQVKLDYIEKKGIKRVVLPREMTKEENDLLNCHIGISHSNLEDLLLFTAAGGAYLWMLLSRWAMSFLIVWGIRVTKSMSR